MTRIIFPLLLSVAALVSGPAAAQTASAPIEIAPDAPDVYTVVPGDTLWGISGRFLNQPWRWPEVWRVNRDEIANPHLIYPGQTIVLDRSGPYLSIGSRIATAGDVRLSPQVYTETLDSAIPSIPISVIEPFLIRPLVVDEAQISESGTVIATETSRVLLGSGDTVFAKDIAPGSRDTWQIYRSTTPIVDPDTKETLGYEALHLGSARVTAYGEPTTLQIISALEEIKTGDRLIVSERPQVFAYMPHAPSTELEGRIIGIHRGVAETGRHAVVTLNIGSYDGVDEGHVLMLHRNRGSVVYKEDGRSETFDLPEKRYGTMFVFRVFDRVSYALVMDSDGHVSIGDAVRTP